ncbi:MAG: hypothetical protein A3D24_04940 [Candidatus Blackburnbacteria bacterium RIFCSPHIGHO2_02_FULL_39_13]|uniref:O-antigen ligase-related domain-containing protein n=1 Tax=Candidatus Blackburnbacteria bacterium RIFCSPLOWO2_01_FULL_40_20 TaxID=1797519 RepID=A0A1G1VBS4_9BACT|nr:MAG: hypothetical protein UT38_C0022G0016 [Microgenomates group bacterium GW2011_GWA2_39_19]OGY07130.1 MAG: hypothetical protein A2694_03610 [Candidatus Blackburnbacteria bacterium RIFCSPHIGHO2_01_FULL_40_17]OGY08952.1 MAG: hypothetical protein A3D24_04940 [Candidatus Blackburnbacteria bacterium RIFCSPHIGHO2_02_FULL_39_13]OGY12702.1 MAG: hypothetical protein A3A77_00205 [Candidatus Blackburnbacteria bacterium RIFCSPLOWO2_01_FULL_40_20]HBL52353.1 hypothetical protein [Candidatus Blackburnbact
MQKIYEGSQGIIEFCFLALFIITPFLFTPFNSELFELNKMLFVYAITTIIVGTWVTKSIAVKRLIFKRTFLDIPLLLFLASQVMSTIFSIDRHVSLWGYYSRSQGGLLSTISYLVLYWAFVSNINKSKIENLIRYLLIGATILSIYAMLEHFGVSPSCLIIGGEFNVDCWVQDVQSRVFATLGQPNWLAAWLVAVMPLAWHKLDQAKTGEKGLYFSASILMFAALLFTKSRSGILGFIVALGIFWIFYASRHSISHVKKPLLLLTVCFSLLTVLVGTPWTPGADKLLEQRANIIEVKTGTVLENGGTESGDIRKIVWKGAVDIWRAHPLFGSGVETFAFSYYSFRPIEHNQTSEWDFLYNKAHNEYLNFAATTGSVGLLTYLVIIATFLIWSFSKLKTSTLQISLLAGFSSILVTNFFGFSTVSVALLFFLYPAVGVNSYQKIENSNSKTNSPLNIRQVIAIIIFLLLTIYFSLRVSFLWLADYYYAQSQKLNKQGFHISALKDIKKSVNFKPNEPLFYDELSQTAANIAIDLTDQKEATDSALAAKLALDSSNFALSISPRSLSLLKSRAATSRKLAYVDPKYLSGGVGYLERAVQLAPTDPKIRYNLGALYSRLGDNEKAMEILQIALKLKPDYMDAIKGLEELNGTKQGKK